MSGREISKNLNKTGKITVNGSDKDKLANFSAFSAYVQQDDILFQTMTVRECLEFAARLKLSGDEAEKVTRVNYIIATLKLTKCQNTRIGGPLVKGVSGGERKRTSIGVELITDPSLIFLDEPTTGLDSFTATSVMETLGDLARYQKRTVISTIHQPNSDIYEMFDNLMLLARGRILYFNLAKHAVNYFGSIGFKCPELSNPADFFMSMMSKESIEFEKEDESGSANVDGEYIEQEYMKLIKFFDDQYKESELRCKHDVKHEECRAISADFATNTAPWCYQFNLLARRNFLNLVRLPQTSYVKLVTTLVTALFAALLFWQAGAYIPYTPSPIPNPAQATTYFQTWQNLQGCLFFVTMNIAFNAIQNVVLIFPDERPVFLREVNNNMYKVGPYFWAKIFSELPFAIITPCLFGVIVYWTVGLNPDGSKFLLFLVTLVLIYNASSGYSLIISASFSDKQLAVTLTPVLIIPFMLFAGFFVSSDQIPVYLKEFEYLSIFKYGYQALMQLEFQDNKNFPCATENSGNYTQGCQGTNPFSQISNQSLGSSLGCLTGLYVVCYMLSWLLLSVLSRKYE